MWVPCVQCSAAAAAATAWCSAVQHHPLPRSAWRPATGDRRVPSAVRGHRRDHSGGLRGSRRTLADDAVHPLWSGLSWSVLLCSGLLFSARPCPARLRRSPPGSALLCPALLHAGTNPNLGLPSPNRRNPKPKETGPTERPFCDRGSGLAVRSITGPLPPWPGLAHRRALGSLPVPRSCVSRPPSRPASFCTLSPAALVLGSSPGRRRRWRPGSPALLLAAPCYWHRRGTRHAWPASHGGRRVVS